MINKMHINLPRKTAVILTLGVLIIFAACKPPVERTYEQSFALRAARELDSAGDTTGARYYLQRAMQETAARDEARNFLNRIAGRAARAGDCIDEKKTDLEINRYPRIRHKHLFQLGMCLEAANEPAKALNFYNLSAVAGSKQPQLYIRRAFLKERLGDANGMRADLALAVSLNADYLPAVLHQMLAMPGTGKATIDEALLARFRATRPAYAEIIADAVFHQDEFMNFRKSPRGNP